MNAGMPGIDIVTVEAEFLCHPFIMRLDIGHHVGGSRKSGDAVCLKMRNHRLAKRQASRRVDFRSGWRQIMRKHHPTTEAIRQDRLRNTHREAPNNNLAAGRCGGARAAFEICAVRTGDTHMAGRKRYLVDRCLQLAHRKMVERSVATLKHPLIQRIAHHAGRTGIVPVEPSLVTKP